MKPVQILFDEGLLAQLDADDEVRRMGRSAVIRRVARAYLRRRERERIVREYRAAYGSGDGLSDEFEGWEEEGKWPQE